MVGNLHALMLIALPLLTLLACAAGGRPDRPRQRTSVLLGGVLILIVLAGSLSAHGCNAGQPVMQWGIPGVCLLATVLWVHNQRLAGALAVASALAMFGLSFHYSEVVHGPIYVGDPNYGKTRAARLIRELSLTSQVIEELTEKNDATYPAGWLAETALVAQHRKAFEGVAMAWERVEVSPLWHSRLTRLYRRTTRPVEMWYPGGEPRDAAARLEWRERPRD